MSSTLFLSLTAVSIVFLFVLTVTVSAFQKEVRHSPTTKAAKVAHLFFFTRFIDLFFKNETADNLLRALICGQTTSRFFLITFSLFALIQTPIGKDLLFDDALTPNEGLILIGGIFALLALLLIVGDLLPRSLGLRLGKKSFKTLGPLSSLILTFLSPIIYLYLKTLSFFAPKTQRAPSAFDVKEKIIEMIEEGPKDSPLDPSEEKLVESLLTFRKKLAKEVLIPRVDIVALPADTTVREAVNLLMEEKYSRIPIYETGMDHMTGILMHKDLFNFYFNNFVPDNEHVLKKLDTPIKELAKEPFFTPETKKISQLLTAFRETQGHMAIVVDEYGRTEGLITIEDILEELVGEISDEYDEEEPQFIPLAEGGYLVDAQMTLLDAKEKLGLNIPEEGDYETIGGYISYLAGTIPPKGSVLDHDRFHMEIVSATDRMVDQVKITLSEKKSS